MRRAAALFLALGALIGCGSTAPTSVDIQATVTVAFQETAQAAQIAAAVQATQIALIPTATPDNSVAQYQSDAGAQANALTEALSKMTALLQSEDAHTQAWKDDMLIQVQAIRAVHQRVQELSPPPKYTSAHAALVAATSDCDEGATYIPEGIEGNTKFLNRAIEYLGRCGSGLAMAVTQLATVQP